MHHGLWQITPSQCAQAESALYWFSWRHAGCLGIGIILLNSRSTGHMAEILVANAKSSSGSFTTATRTDKSPNRIDEIFSTAPYRLHMIASTWLCLLPAAKKDALSAATFGQLGLVFPSAPGQPLRSWRVAYADLVDSTRSRVAILQDRIPRSCLISLPTLWHCSNGAHRKRSRVCAVPYRTVNGPERG